MGRTTWSYYIKYKPKIEIRTVLFKQAGRYSFFNISTEYGDVVSIAQYHQMCRYGINLEEKDGRILLTI